jgi:2-oxoglutarate ferredoxin oxidoreductase subunit delta
VPKLVIDETRCKGCALCVQACPRNLIAVSEKINKQGFLPAQISPENLRECTSCALCAQMCPDVAITVYREGKDARRDGNAS